MERYQLLVLLLLALLSTINALDPCQSGFTFKTLPRSQYRGSNCSGKLIFRRTSDALLPDGWYRGLDNRGNNINLVTQPPNMYSCSSYNPIWMNGSTPLYNEGIVDRNVCIRTSVRELCGQSMSIKVRNCSSFIAYRLIGSAFTDSAYCFGEKNSCPPFDPCEEFYRKGDLHDDGLRSKSCKSKTPRCDNTVKEGWYKLTDESWRHPANLLLQKPSFSYCGTTHPLWMNGTIPKVIDGEVDRSVCVSMLTDACGKSFTIKVKNCSTFVVYKLKPPQECDQRYCLDTKGKCQFKPTTTQHVTSDAQDTIVPKDSDPLTTIEIILTVLVGIFGIGLLLLHCCIFWWLLNYLLKTNPQKVTPTTGKS